MPNQKTISTILFALTVFLGWAKISEAANYYIDSVATGANNGSSWADAWESFQDISGLVDGDIVYISAGTSGNTKNYTLNYFGGASAEAHGGTSSAITYKVGQDAGHNGGTAVFNITGTYCIYAPSHMVISGDAGDGLRHFAFPNNQNKYPISDTSNSLTDFLIEYFNFGEQTVGVRIDGAYDCEISHCYLKKLENDDVTKAWKINGNSSIFEYDKILFHDNVSYCPYVSGTGQGDDHLVSSTRGISIYSNSFYGYIDNNYYTGQHGDGIQPGSGHYMKIYNNYFQDIHSYGIYLEAIAGSDGYEHIRIYNNIFTRTEAHTGGSSSAIGAAPKISDIIYSDIIIANNLIVDYVGSGSGSAIGSGDSSGDATFIDYYIVNNISFNAGVISATDEAINLSNNVDTDTNYFNNYTLFGADSNDHHILSSATELINTGIDLTSYGIPAIDRDGEARVSSWDIGPYEYISAASDTTPPAAPGGLSVQ